MCLCIEHIPEVKHHKDSEEETKFVSRYTVVCTPCEWENIGQRSYIVMLEIEQQSQADECEGESHTKYRLANTF